MLFFLLSCFSFIILSNSSFFKQFPIFNLQINSFSFQCFFKHLLTTTTTTVFSNCFSHLHTLNPSNPQALHNTHNNKNKKDDVFLLDLPDLPLECILEKLSPAGLACMSGVCRSFRAMCTQDHLWETHLKQKWGKFLTGDSMYKEWQAYIDAKTNSTLLKSSNGKGCFRNFTWWKKNVKTTSEIISLPVDSIMSWYLSLETGKFSFPAQVYNRENGNIGFLLSCYDAKVTYDSHTDSFKARYSSRGRPTIEENIKWERLRSPAVDVSPYDLHVSDCLTDLHPGDHFEIQWRKSKEFPYGWWYGVVGHLESCDGNKLYCQCHHSDAVILEFKQYNLGSRWREVTIDRKDHLEVGSEADGFYAGIRKLYDEKDIMKWKSL